ncbi:MAG: hypothetical protein AAGI69_13640 [Cyanobacteria bacterium P01_H01_bin.21]
MGRNRRLNVLWGGLIGCCLGLVINLLLPSLMTWSPTLYWLIEVLGEFIEPFVDRSIQLICETSLDTGCASGLGLLMAFVLWPMIFCILGTLAGAVMGLVLAYLKSS